MIIASFNINGIRARLPILLDWIKAESPDVVCLQETKVQDENFPREPLEAAGFHCVFRGQKSYNGVAILSKTQPEDVSYGFPEGEASEETRMITAVIRDISVVNTYVPQGYAPNTDKFVYKLEWFQRLQNYFSRYFDPAKPLVWVGDFNVAPEPIDVYDPKSLSGSIGFHPDERQALAEVKAWGFVDVFRRHDQGPRAYTFWDYRIPNAVKRGLGWRVDHIWATPCLAQKSTRAWIDMAPRLREKPSDHTAIVAEFDLP